MILTAVTAAVLAVFQFILDTALFRSIFAGKAPKAIGMLLVKLALYAGGFALLFLRFRDYVPGAAVGFGVGFFPAVLAYGLAYSRRKTSAGSRDTVGSHQSEVESQAAIQGKEE